MSDQNQQLEVIKDELIPLSALESITRGEIDLQIATAHRYPRSMAQFKKRALDMALIDEETAESCIYCRPVGMKDGKQTYAEGMSVRMAEIVGASYGNLRVGSMIIEQTERFVKCRGMAHDLESNFASSSECMEPTVTRDGRPFSEGMRAVVAKACLAKAWRDALFKVVPKALCRPIESETRKLMAGDAKSLEFRRTAVMQWIGKLGIDTARVFKALSIDGEEDIGTEQLMILTGIKTAIKDGDTKIEEAFPPLIQRAQIANVKQPAAQDVTKTEVLPPEGKPEPKKEAKPKPAAAKKEPAAPAPTDQPGTESDLAAKLEAEGFTVAELCAAVVKFGLVEKAETLADLGPKNIAEILKDWDTASATMRQMKEKQPA